jgi:hypothetical protein
MNLPRANLLVSLALVAGVLGITVPAAPVGAALEAPVVAAYFAWFGYGDWTSRKSSDLPAVPYNPYNLDDRATIERHVRQARSPGIDAFAVDWLGPGNRTDRNLRPLLAVAAAHDFKVTVAVDPLYVQSFETIRQWAIYAQQYFRHPAWLYYQGRPVIIFYGVKEFLIEAWRALRDELDPQRRVLWRGEGDVFTYLQVFDGIHPFSIAWSADPVRQLASYANRTRAYPGKLWMATVIPGYDDTRLGRTAPNNFAVDRQDGAYYLRVWQGAIAIRPELIMIASWNEWLEGSQSVSYGDLYLRLTRQMVEEYHRAMGLAPALLPPSTCAFFAEAGGGQGGYAITDEGGIGFWTSFQALGGVAALGYPLSHRFQRDGYVYQATQVGVLQWRPELGRAVLANTFDWLSEAGHDEWLLAQAGIPRPVRDDGSQGDWQRAREIRQRSLTDAAILQAYLTPGSVDAAIEHYGLPMSRPERRWPFVVQRFQRIAFQHWVEEVPGMPPRGSVAPVLAGELLKPLGMIPPEAARPASP